jgi:hypothetical protein
MGGGYSIKIIQDNCDLNCANCLIGIFYGALWFPFFINNFSNICEEKDPVNKRNPINAANISDIRYQIRVK